MYGVIYCRQCGYDLRAQSVPPYRCPECGREFNPTDRKTFLARPPRGAVWRRAIQMLILLLMLGLALAASWGWLYWGWKKEQVAKAKSDALFQEVEPLGGEKLKACFGSAGWVLDRAKRVLFFDGTDANLIYLKEFNGPQELILSGEGITDAGLISLKELKGLRKLVLRYTNVTESGLVHLKEIKGLQDLDAEGLHMTDTGLAHLKELKGLKHLNLRGARVTKKGVEELQRALPSLKIDGVAYLFWRQADEKE